MKRSWTLLATLCLMLVAGSMRAEDLKFAGCSISAVAYMKDMAKAYREKYGVPVEVGGGGVPIGIKATLDGKVQLGGSCRHLLSKEEQAGAVSTVVGYDMLVVLAHPSNPVESLTLSQVRDIFSGRITNWKDVGGEDQKITIVGREADDAGVRVMFQDLVMKGLPQVKDVVPLESTSLVEREMESNVSGIAVSGVSSARLRNVKILKLDGVSAGKKSLADGSYPLLRPLYLVTKGKPAGETKRFIDFVLSKEGQQIMAKNAFSIPEYKLAKKRKA